MTQPLAYGYIRVSTFMQKDDGISLDTQTKKIVDYCNYKNFKLVTIFDDGGKSGGSMTERDQLNTLLDKIKKENYFIVAELSRLSRNIRDALYISDLLEKKGAFFISLDPNIDFSTPIGKMMFTTLISFHELERKQTSTRVRENMINLSKQNKLRPTPPFGWKFVSKEKPFEKNDDQQKIIELIRDLHYDGKTVLQISEILNDCEFNKTLNDKNSKFHPTTVRNIMIRNEIVEPTDRYTVKKIKEMFFDSRIANIR